MRLPRYYRIRLQTEVLLVVAGVFTTVLGFLKLEAWVPIVAALVGAIVAWLEFNGTSKKLARYSDVVQQTSSLILWWERLTDVDRASLANIEQLITRGEEMFATERQAWLSTSMVMKALAAGNKGAEEDGEP